MFIYKENWYCLCVLIFLFEHCNSALFFRFVYALCKYFGFTKLNIVQPVVNVIGDVNQFYRKLARQRRESRVEDLPFKISSAVSDEKFVMSFPSSA